MTPLRLRGIGRRARWLFVVPGTLLPLATSTIASQCPTDTGPPRPFGPQISAADSGRIYTSVISADGREFYDFRRVGDLAENYRIFRSIRTGSGWGPAQQLRLGGDWSDLYPALSADGSRLVFASYRPAPGDTSSKRNAHLWMVRREGSGWGAPGFVAASVLGHYHSGLTLDVNGTLRFRLTSPDWREQVDAELPWLRDRFAPQIIRKPPLPVVEYWRKRSGDSIHVWGAIEGPDGLALLSVSRLTEPNRRRGPAQYFVTRPAEAGWAPLVRAPGALGAGSPNFAWFSKDGCYLYFTRDYSEFMRVPVGLIASTLRQAMRR